MEDKYIAITHSMIRRKDLTMQEKIVYLEILNLSSLEKGCIASNSHFEKSFGISKKSVSNTISSLSKKGFISVELSERNHKRILSIKDVQVSIKDGQVSIKDGESKENKTINKTINIVIEYLNSKTGKKFSSKSKDSMMIGTLLRSNYTEEDCKRVIDEKVSQWINNPDMSKYLRPNTLFGSKFDRYLNEALSSSKPQTKGKMVIGGKVV
jgi:uncharacterized phage protein (TIGR02220 family)